MNNPIRSIAVAMMSAQLVLVSGCVNPDGTPNNTASGALLGGALGALSGAAVGGYRHGGQDALIGAAIGAVAGAVAGTVMDRINEQQQAQLQQQSPQTWQTIQHNDAVVQQQQQQAPEQASPTGGPPPPAGAVTPITLADVKALTSAGVKPDAINQEIETSKATFTSDDVAAAQQASVDASVIQCMKNHPA